MATENETTKPVTTKQAGKTVEVTEDIVIQTNAFDATKPDLLGEAEATFRENVAQAYKGIELKDVRLIKINHHVGSSATYVMAGTLTV